MSFLEHLEELRWHIIRSVVAIVAFMIVAFAFKSLLFDTILIAPSRPEFITNRLLCQFGQYLHDAWNTENPDILCINNNDFQLISIKMAGQITTHIIVALVAGLILAFPFVIREFWSFFKPALHSNEAKHARGAVLASTLLFFTGILFGYFVLAPLSIHFLTSYQVSETVANQINIQILHRNSHLSLLCHRSSIRASHNCIFPDQDRGDHTGIHEEVQEACDCSYFHSGGHNNTS